jgi:hypothetical protein
MQNAPILHPDDISDAQRMTAGQARDAVNAITQVQRLIDGMSRLLDERDRLATGKQRPAPSSDEEREAHYDPDLPTPDEIEVLALIETGGDPLTSDVDTTMAQRTLSDLQTIQEISIAAHASRIQPDFSALSKRAQWLAKLTRSRHWPDAAKRVQGLTEQTGKRLRSLVDPAMWKATLGGGVNPALDLALEVVPQARRANPAPQGAEHGAALDGATAVNDAYPVGAAAPEATVDRSATAPQAPLMEAAAAEEIHWAPEMRPAEAAR